MRKEGFVNFEVVMEIHSASDCVFLKSILDSEEIEYLIQGEHVAPYVFHSVPMRLMVNTYQVEKVKALLSNFVQSTAYEGLKRVK